MNEFDLISTLSAELSQDFLSGELGIGDDSAIISPINDHKILLTKDLLIEGVHFDLNYFSLEDVGWKSLAVNESDILAMGGTIKAFLVGLALPKERLGSAVSIYRGMNEYLNLSSGKIFGGDTVASDKLIVSVTALGFSNKPIRRDGACPGDILYLSGALGYSYLGLNLLNPDLSSPLIFNFSLCEEAIDLAKRYHRRPALPFELSKNLRNVDGVTSMIDISDGLFQDIGHIAENSKVSFILDLEQIPIVGDFSSPEEIIRIVSGGEDYQLAFTVSPLVDLTDLLLAFPNCKRIGEVLNKDAAQIYLRESNPKGKVTPILDKLKELGLESVDLGFSHYR